MKKEKNPIKGKKSVKETGDALSLNIKHIKEENYTDGNTIYDDPTYQDVPFQQPEETQEENDKGEEIEKD